MLTFSAAMAFLAAAPATPPVPEKPRAVVLTELHERTGNAALLWLIAEAHVAANRPDLAIATLERIADGGLGMMVTRDSPLAAFAGDARFDSLAARLAKQYRRASAVTQVASIKEDRFIPEGLAIDGATGRIFVGDMAGKRIFTFRAGEPHRPFAATGDLRPLGMKVDPRRGVLWIAATTAFVAAEAPRSALIALDLASGEQKHFVTAGDLKSINDIAIAPDGAIYVTDSLGGSVFALSPALDALTRIVPEGSFGYPNGIAASDDGRWLYVAQGISIMRIDRQSGQFNSLSQPADLALWSVDGLYSHQGGLIAVQNGAGAGRVLRLRLSPDGGSIASFNVLEAAHPYFDIPTTGAIMDDRFLVIANSQLDRLKDDGSVLGDPALKPVSILAVPLAP